jgi:nicotinate phosphoribosyltransferase
MSANSSANPLHSALFTDLYELTMAQAYLAEGLDQPAVFELLFRHMPPTRNYLVAAGLDDVLAYLEDLHFTHDDLTYLRDRLHFSETFLVHLAQLRFTGDVYAVPEGTPVFPGEPLIQVVAPIVAGQLIETAAINQVHLQTLAAAKAARLVTAAGGRQVVDFGARRAHGADAALKVARTSYLAGAAGTSLVLAGEMHGIPLFGTMAHSYIQAHEDEAAAFEAFTAMYPQTTLLVDTYDTLAGIQKVIELSRKLGDRFRVQAVRLDSGDFVALAKQARQMLDAAGLTNVRIFASSDLDEYKIAELVASGAPIDGFGVGTKLATIDDVPHVDMAYKLVEYAGQPKIKLSPHKVSHPGRKQIFREMRNGRMVRDIIGRHDEKLPGEPLLQPVMRAGQRMTSGRVSLENSRRHALHEHQRLPEPLRDLKPASTPYPVEVSDALKRDLQTLRQKLEASGADQ